MIRTLKIIGRKSLEKVLLSLVFSVLMADTLKTVVVGCLTSYFSGLGNPFSLHYSFFKNTLCNSQLHLMVFSLPF